MPEGEDLPVVYVTLECGHIRRYFEPTENKMYYCFTCDDHVKMKERLTDPRARPGGHKAL